MQLTTHEISTQLSNMSNVLGIWASRVNWAGVIVSDHNFRGERVAAERLEQELARVIKVLEDVKVRLPEGDITNTQIHNSK